MQIEAFSDYVRRRVPQCSNCRRFRNGGERCECRKGSGPTLRIPSDDELRDDYNAMLDHASKEGAK